MALKKCVQCGWDVSSEAANCPGCGAPVSPPVTRINWEPCPRCASGRVRHLDTSGCLLWGVGLVFGGVAFLVFPPLGVCCWLAVVYFMTRAKKNRACLDCLFSWRYPSKAAQNSSNAHSGQAPLLQTKGSSRLILGGVLVVLLLFVLFIGYGFILLNRSKAELAQANEFWLAGRQAEAVGIYTRELVRVDDADKPEVFNRIITQLYDSGDKEGATNYYNKAIEGGLNIEFTHSDLRRFFDKAREAIEAPKRAEEAEKERLAQEKQAEEQRLAMESAVQDQQSQAQAQANLDGYSALLTAAGVTVVREYGVKCSGDLWTVTLSVDDVWHIKPYQIRLQDAQAFWEAWARIASPNEPDKARISIKDLRGNEVGGSRMLAGSLIWVQEQ